MLPIPNFSLLAFVLSFLFFSSMHGWPVLLLIHIISITICDISGLFSYGLDLLLRWYPSTLLRSVE